MINSYLELLADEERDAKELNRLNEKLKNTSENKLGNFKKLIKGIDNLPQK